MTTCSQDNSAGSVREVLALLREEAALYERLQVCADRQRSLVARDDLSPLLALLADRQALSVELTRIGECLAPVRRNWREYRKNLTEPEREEADELVACIEKRLRRAIESDEEDVRLLQARKQSVSQALQAAHSTGQALRAYRVPSPAPRRIDHVNEGT